MNEDVRYMYSMLCFFPTASSWWGLYDICDRLGIGYGKHLL